MSIEGEVEKENLMNTPSSFQDSAGPTGVGPFVCIPALGIHIPYLIN